MLKIVAKRPVDSDYTYEIETYAEADRDRAWKMLNYSYRAQTYPGATYDSWSFKLIEVK